MGKKKGSSYNSTDESGASSSDDAELVMNSSDGESSGAGRRRKYIVSEGNPKSSLCKPSKLSRNELICLLVGVVVLAVIILLFIIVAVVVSTSSSSTSSATEQWTNVRLPGTITPEEYTIHLNVALEGNFPVEGNTTISARVNSSTQYVIIHATDMSISEATITQNGGQITIKTKFFYLENDYYVMELSRPLQPGMVSIFLSFNYTLRDDLVGFYLSSYKTLSGDTRHLATTQFEPTDARRAFPCFDEPAMKANFTISITHDSQYFAVSNMPSELTRRRSSNGLSTTQFRPSVKMSTYLVAFVVSDFDHRESMTDSGVQVRVFSNPEVIDKTEYALSVAVEVLAFYEERFNLSYPLPKLDLFAIPDFAAGAMENWGLVTYRETALLFDNQTDPASSQQRVAVVIAHELAHQWFGNLVTMAWWDGLWLNEGFASFTEYIGTDKVEPDFGMLDQFFVSDLAYALQEDSLNESHPILQEVNNPDEINSLFDTISYSKGSSVIRMLQYYMEEDRFLAGINNYLKQHEYGNAETSELWDALQEEWDGSSTVTVAEVMDTWTKQMGYPVVTVNQSSNTLTQTRFFAIRPENESTIPPSPYNYLWKVPFEYKTEHNPTVVRKLLVEESTPFDLRQSDGGWVKANVDQTGFYRVNYEFQNWWALSAHLKSNPNSMSLTPVDRAGLLDDAFALASAGLLDTVTALNLSCYIREEREYVPWAAAIDWYFTWGLILRLTPVYGDYEAFLRSQLSDAVAEFGFEREELDHLQIFLRSRLLSAAWKVGNEEVIQNATRLFNDWKEHNETIDPNLKGVVYSVGVAFGSLEDWDYLWDRYTRSNDPYEKGLLLRALAESRVPWILNRYLNYSISKVRVQDTLSIVRYVSQNVYGQYLAWNFLRANWDYFIEVYGSGSFSFARLIRTLTEAFSTELELNEVEEFFMQHSDAGSGMRASRQAIEVIRRNVRWLQNNMDTLASCLRDTENCFS